METDKTPTVKTRRTNYQKKKGLMGQNVERKKNADWDKT
jgi:hypothetical protein